MATVRLRFLMLLVAVSGCGAGQGGPGVYQAEGTVTYQGAPVAACSVVFTPKETTGRAFNVQGKTDENGRFSLFTSNVTGSHYEEGAAAGVYGVAITKFDEQIGNGERPPKNHLPMKYARPTTSGLEAEISPEGPNDFSYRLED